ncbi:MAG TPA: M48 family metalloprotease, partial [Solirubrobacteraceae bacterium]
GAEDGTPGALPHLMLAAGLVAGPTGVIGNRLSRAIERRADADSLELSNAPEAFIAFERRIAVQNVADLRPPRIVTALFATHPPTAERIGAAVAWPSGPGEPSSATNGAGLAGESSDGADSAPEAPHSGDSRYS